LNEPNDTKKDLFILIKKFKQESHERASQNRARQPFELIKLKLCCCFLNEQFFRLIRHLFIVWNRLKPFQQFAVCTETVLDLEPFGSHWSPLYGEKSWSWNVFIKNLWFLFEWRKNDMDILDDMEV